MRGRRNIKHPRARVVMATFAVPVLVSEAVYFATTCAAKRAAGKWPADGRGAVVVLGVPGRSMGSRAVQRWRVGMAVRAWREHRCERVIFSGGAVRTVSTEAADMAAIARRMGLPDQVIVLEEQARSTRENVSFAVPLVGEVDYVIIASDVLHATRAKTYWLQQQQHRDVTQVVLADRYRPFDHFWLRLPTATFEILMYLRHRRRTARGNA